MYAARRRQQRPSFGNHVVDEYDALERHGRTLEEEGLVVQMHGRPFTGGGGRRLAHGTDPLQTGPSNPAKTLIETYDQLIKRNIFQVKQKA